MATNENAIEVSDQHISKGPLLGIRHLQTFMLFLGIVTLYSNRMQVAMSLVAMTSGSKNNQDFPLYKWNEQQKSFIISSFYWGYIVTQIPGAYFSRRFGVKISLFVFNLLTGLFSLLVPFCVAWGGWQVFCLLRCLQGLSQGGLYAAVFQHLAKWSPPAERSFLVGFTHTSFDCSDLLAMALSGIIATSSLGWPGIYYIYASFCFVWCALWLILGADNATKSSFITSEERFYIESSLKNSVDFQENPLPVPWRAILTSKPFLILVAVRALSLGGLITIQAEWPTYVNSVLGLDIEHVTLYAALPFVVSWFSTYIFAFISNFITKRNSLSTTTLRKVFDTFGLLIPAMGLVFLGFLNKNHRPLALIMMIVILATHNTVKLGSVVCLLDMAPNHTEILSSIASMISNCFVLLGPLYVGLIVSDEQNPAQWQLVFATIAVVFFISNIIFIIWGTAEVQPWNAAGFSKNIN